MSSSRISSTSRSTSSGTKTSSEPLEFTSSDFEDIFDSSTAALISSTVARRPLLTISSSERPNPTSISGTSIFVAPSSLPHLPTSTSPSALSPNLFPVTSSQVSHPSSEASHNENVIGPGTIAVIAASSFAFILILVAFVVILLRRRRNRFPKNEAGSRAHDSEEKYMVRSHYGPYGDAQHKETLLDQGVAPLLNVPSINSHNRTPSFSSDLESHLYHDGPTSPFLNEFERRAVSNAALNSEASPYLSTESRDGVLDTVVLLPAFASPNPQSRASIAASKLAPLQISESDTIVPPSRRPSKGKNWKRTSSDAPKNPPPAVEETYNSDDSESLYSQASASTHRTFTFPPPRQSSIQPFSYPYSSVPLPSIPQSPYQGNPTASSSSKLELPRGVVYDKPSSNSVYVPSPVESLGTRDEEGSGALGREETLLVATLLQSRLSRVPKQGLAPNRSSSIVSHIERAGSIKPALAAVETTGGAKRYGPRSRASGRWTGTRDTVGVRSQILNGSDLRNGSSDS